MLDQQHLAAAVVDALIARGETVSTCESLTAGLLSAAIAGIPGASAALEGGLITYSESQKRELAGVPASVIDSFGVVSKQCSEAMALGARDRCRTTWAVALTGVAGPTQQDGHPVGEVWIAIAGPSGVAHVGRVEPDVPDDEKKPLGECGRNEIRNRCVTYALKILLDVLSTPELSSE